MIRRKKLTIFTDAKDTTSVLELKKIIEGELLNVHKSAATYFVKSDKYWRLISTDKFNNFYPQNSNYILH